MSRERLTLLITWREKISSNLVFEWLDNKLSKISKEFDLTSNRGESSSTYISRGRATINIMLTVRQLRVCCDDVRFWQQIAEVLSPIILGGCIQDGKIIGGVHFERRVEVQISTDKFTGGKMLQYFYWSFEGQRDDQKYFQKLYEILQTEEDLFNVVLWPGDLGRNPWEPKEPVI